MRCSRPMVQSVVLALWAFFYAALSTAAAVESTLEDFIEHGGYVITQNGRLIAQFGADTPLIPASTIKIVTALTTLELLGPSHRISTEFYLRDNKILCIKGYGDPYLISERLLEIASELKKRGLTEVESILLDDSFFRLEGPTDGAQNSANPYDAENSALSVNFNSVPLIKYDTGLIGSPEPQTPVLDIARDIGSLVEPGLHRLNVSAFTVRNSNINRYRYVAELIAEQLRRQGIDVGSTYNRGLVEAGDTLIYTYLSKMTVAEMIRGCLQYSNNFIANQLFLYCGVKRFGPPATWEKGQRAVAEFLITAAGLKYRDVTVVEGSGLSRKNLITPAAMIAVLELFKPYSSLLSETQNTLLKSGTMTGVYGYAGYFEWAGRLDPFVILLNQKSNNRERLLKLASTHYRQQAEQN